MGALTELVHNLALSHPELADALMNRILAAVETVGKVEGKVSKDGNRLNAQLVPKTPQK